jgi:hypothetical protein
MADAKPKPEDKPVPEGIRKAHEKFLASGGKTMTTEPAKPDPNFSHYQHYLLVDTIPVRFLIDHQGRRYGAEGPGEKQGTLMPNVRLLSQFDNNEIDFTPIGEEAFKQRLRDYVRRPPVVDSGKGR